MKPIMKKAQRIFDALITGLAAPGESGAYRKVDNTDGAFMAVHVEHYAERVYSIAHTYLQEGDVMDDPSMLFWLDPDDRAYPFTFTQHSLGMDQESVTFDRNGQPEKIAVRLQKEHADFASWWLGNIESQQGITPPMSKTVEYESA